MIQFFEDMVSFKSSVRPLRSIATELREALDGSDQFSVRYQPIIASASGKVEFAEAFVRWTSPVLGEVLPGRFIHIAEQNGLIRDVTRMVLHNVCEDIAKHRELVVSVNISKADITDPEFADEMKDLMEEYSINPRQVILECTDSLSTAEAVKAAPTIKQLRQQGHAVAIYELDSGFTTFGFLKMSSYTLLKIDKVLLDEALQSTLSRENLQEAVDESKLKGFKSLAFGIESKEQADLVAEMGFDLQQGFYHSLSLSFDELVTFMRQRKTSRAIIND